eukprot:m.909308 g.909308  ORF g.909308 m.909308 type:complete len:129 (+) comp23719_c0_seq21:3366-3752(+)
MSESVTVVDVMVVPSPTVVPYRTPEYVLIRCVKHHIVVYFHARNSLSETVLWRRDKGNTAIGQKAVSELFCGAWTPHHKLICCCTVMRPTATADHGSHTVELLSSFGDISTARSTYSDKLYNNNLNEN